MIIRQSDITDYKSITEIHLDTFEGFFLTALGKNFLDTYYRACLKNPKCIAICAINDENRMVGFGIGSIEAKGFHKNLIVSNFLQFLFQGIAVLFKKPMAIIRLLKNLDKKPSAEDNGDYAELLSIAVLPLYKGQGVGKLILEMFENEARKRNIKKLALTTDCNNNEDTLLFYKKLNYQVFYKFVTFPNREMFKLIKNL